MSYLRTIKIKNGDMLQDYIIYKCDECGKEIEEMFPRYTFKEDNTDYCIPCSFKKGFCSGEDYLNYIGMCSITFEAYIDSQTNEIKIKKRKTRILPLDENRRGGTKYRNWQQNILKRDNYTCQKCGAKDKVLNAHHIKSYSKNKELRYVIDNGMTLCECCHRKKHSKKK